MNQHLDGTVALVTGASSGIGEATALALAGSGATVALIARRGDRLDKLKDRITASGGTAAAVVADVSDRKQAETAVQQVVTELGRLDIVVNNAGLMRIGPAAESDPADWDDMLSVNVQGLLYVTRASLPHLIRAAADAPRRVADLVNISSTAGRVARPGNAVYALTKFGVGAFSEAVRQEVLGQRVRVGLVEPGTVQTEITTALPPESQAALENRTAGMVKLEPADIADAVVYMVTRDRRVAVNEMLVRAAEQTWWIATNDDFSARIRSTLESRPTPDASGGTVTEQTATALPPVVDQDTWRSALDDLRRREKAATRELDAIAAQRRHLPMVELPDYTLIGADGPIRLADVFDGRAQLIVYNHMWEDGAEWQCGGCTGLTAHWTRLEFLESYDARFVIVTNGPIEEALAYKAKCGNKMEWYSSSESSFGADVDAPPGEGFAVNVFLRDGDKVYRTWHTNGRGTEQLTYTFPLIDLLPWGRQEEWLDSPDGWPSRPTYSGWLDSPDVAAAYGANGGAR